MITDGDNYVILLGFKYGSSFCQSFLLLEVFTSNDVCKKKLFFFRKSLEKDCLKALNSFPSLKLQPCYVTGYFLRKIQPTRYLTREQNFWFLHA